MGKFQRHVEVRRIWGKVKVKVYPNSALKGNRPLGM